MKGIRAIILTVATTFLIVPCAVAQQMPWYERYDTSHEPTSDSVEYVPELAAALKDRDKSVHLEAAWALVYVAKERARRGTPRRR